MNWDGPLFRGRFKSILVGNENYFIEVSRYIHCNPVEANIVKMPEHYKWSSYQYYLYSEQKPNWLYCNETLSYFNNKRSSYKEYVSEGIDEDTKIFFQSSSPLPVFGSEIFIKHIAKENKIVLNNEVIGTTNIFKVIQSSITEIVEIIAVEHNTKVENIINPQTKNEQQLRSKAIYICVRHAKKTHQAILNFFKGVSRSNVSHICKRLDNKIRINNGIIDEIMKIVTVL